MTTSVTPSTPAPGMAPARNAAVFIDMENLFGGYAGDVDGVPIRRMMNEIRAVAHNKGVLSEIAVMRAYANWSDGRLSVYRRELMETGIEPVQVFAFGQQVKNAADIELVVDAMSVAAESPHIDVFVIVSGDGGFVPLVRKLHSLGKYVLVVSAGNPNRLLKAAADHCQIVEVDDDDAPRQTAPASKPAKAKKAATPKSTKTTEAPPLSNMEAIFELINKLVDTNPTVLKNGKLDTAVLGARIRDTYPAFKVEGTGFRTLTGVAGEALKDRPELLNTPAAKPTPATSSAPFPIVSGIPGDRVTLGDTFSAIVNDPRFGPWFDANADSEGRVEATLVLKAAETQHTKFTSKLSVLFPNAKMALRYAFAGTEFGLAHDLTTNTKMSVVRRSSGAELLGDLTEDNLASTAVVIEVLGRSQPVVRIVNPVLFGDLIEVVTELPDEAMRFAALVDLVLDDLEDWPAEDIRRALTGLANLGVIVFEATDGVQLVDRMSSLAPGLDDTDACFGQVIEGIEDILDQFGWPTPTELFDELTRVDADPEFIEEPI